MRKSLVFLLLVLPILGQSVLADPLIAERTYFFSDPNGSGIRIKVEVFPVLVARGQDLVLVRGNGTKAVIKNFNGVARYINYTIEGIFSRRLFLRESLEVLETNYDLSYPEKTVELSRGRGSDWLIVGGMNEQAHSFPEDFKQSVRQRLFLIPGEGSGRQFAEFILRIEPGAGVLEVTLVQEGTLISQGK
jgi:hypothetical protein